MVSDAESITMDQPSIFGIYCVLDHFDEAKHGNALFLNLCNENDVFGNINLYGPFQTYSDFIKWAMVENPNEVSYTLVVVLKDKPHGIISIHGIDYYNKTCEIGVTFSKELQNTSAATESIYLVIDHLFNKGFRRVQWHCITKNLPSINAAKRLYFTEEVFCHKFYIHNNEQLDGLYLSIIDEEWIAIKEKYISWLDVNNFDYNNNQLKKLNNNYQLTNCYNLTHFANDDLAKISKSPNFNIDSNRYLLRKIDLEKDISEVFNFATQNPEMFYYKNYGNFKNEEQLLDWFNKFNNTWTHYLIVSKLTGKILSVLSIVMISESSGIIELYLLLCTNNFLDQYFSEIVESIKKEFFQRHNYQRIQLITIEDNLYLNNIMKKNNFIHEGVFRKLININTVSYNAIMWQI